MKWRNLVRVLLYGGSATLLVSFHKSLVYWTSTLPIPERLGPNFLRVLLILLIVETLRQIIIGTYVPDNPKLKRDNFTIGISHLSKVVYGLLFVVLLLSLFNISIKEALTTLSLIAAAVVLITKDYIANLINGMYLTFARVVSVGDQVAIDGNKGKILDITLTNVHLLNEDDDIVYIPNNKVFSSEIINYTRRELKKSNIDFEVDPLVVFDLEELENKLIEVLKPFEKDIVQGSCNLKTAGLKRDCINLKFQYIMVEPLNKDMDKKVKKYLTRELLKILHKEMEEM